MSAILRLASSYGRRITSLWRNPAYLVATAPPCLPGLLLAFALTAPAWLPVLHPALNLSSSVDGIVHLVRAYSLQQHIASGDWYPRWLSEHYGSYGYPALNFYAPATYYLTVLLAWLLPMIGTHGGLQLMGAVAALGMISGDIYARLAALALRTGGPLCYRHIRLRSLPPPDQSLHARRSPGGDGSSLAHLAARGLYRPLVCCN